MSKTYVVLHTGDDMLEYYEDETAYLEEGGLKGSVATRYAKVKPVTPMVLTSQTMATTSQSKTSLMATESLNLLVNLNVKALKGEICRCKRFKHPITMPQSNARGLILRSTFKSEAEGAVGDVSSSDTPNTGIGRVHYFHAANEQECLAWTKALQEAIAHARSRRLATSM
jgi:hypothetical protein